MWKEFRVKGRHQHASIIFDESRMSLPMILLSIDGENCLSIEKWKERVNMLKVDRDFGIEEMDISCPIFFQALVGCGYYWPVFGASMNSDFVIIVRFKVVDDFLSSVRWARKTAHTCVDGSRQKRLSQALA